MRGGVSRLNMEVWEGKSGQLLGDMESDPVRGCIGHIKKPQSELSSIGLGMNWWGRSCCSLKREGSGTMGAHSRGKVNV